MSKLKRILLIVTSMMLLICNTGCWNYFEIDDMSIVAGVAIDKGKKTVSYW